MTPKNTPFKMPMVSGTGYAKSVDIVKWIGNEINKVMDIKQLKGKTIKNIEQPSELYFVEYGRRDDDNIVITFTDGSVLKLASWDCEGYSSGIYKEIITPKRFYKNENNVLGEE